MHPTHTVSQILLQSCDVEIGQVQGLYLVQGCKISAVEELCALTHLFVIMKFSRADKTIRYLKIS